MTLVHRTNRRHDPLTQSTSFVSRRRQGFEGEKLVRRRA